MADLKNWFFRQKVLESDLDTAFGAVEASDLAQMVDLDLTGLYSGLTVTQKTPGVADLTVDIAPGVAYSRLGERIAVNTKQNLDCSVDENSVSTTVTIPGESRVLSVYIGFDRELADPRVDGNSVTIFYTQNESFELILRQGPAATSPSLGAEQSFIATYAPAIDSDYILLADIILDNAQTQITNADIFTFRREHSIYASSVNYSITADTPIEAFSAVLQVLDDFVNADLDASVVPWDNDGHEWAISAGDILTATNVEEALFAVIDDLASTTAGETGAHKLGHAFPTEVWANGNTLTTGNVGNTLKSIVDNLADKIATGGSGAHRIGFAVSPNPTWANTTTVSADNVGDVLSEIVSDLSALSGGQLIGSALYSVNGQTFLPAGTVKSQLEYIALNYKRLQIPTTIDLETGVGAYVSVDANLGIGASVGQYIPFGSELTGDPVAFVFGPIQGVGINTGATPAVLEENAFGFVVHMLKTNAAPGAAYWVSSCSVTSP